MRIGTTAGRFEASFPTQALYSGPALCFIAVRATFETVSLPWQASGTHGFSVMTQTYRPSRVPSFKDIGSRGDPLMKPWTILAMAAFGS